MHDADADTIADALTGRTAREQLAWCNRELGPRAVITCSWQRTTSVLWDMCASLEAPCAMRLVEIDTGLLHPQTHATRKRLIARDGLPVETVRPASLAAQAATHGERLWHHDPDACCALRKLAPLAEALAGADVWIAGMRRADGPSRADAPLVQLDSRFGVVRVLPLVDWSDEDVAAYCARHTVPVNPLHALGYDSIGCIPCTRPGAGRAGRWSGNEKTECGLYRGRAGADPARC